MNQHKLMKLVILVAAMLCLSACGGGESSSSSAQSATEPKSTSTPENVVPAAEVSTEDALLKRGRIVWFKCRSCHETSVDGPHKVGPNLHALMGASAGVKDGFVFSDAMKNSGITWDEKTLDKFIEKPTDLVKGTKMAFIGIKKESDRKALIAYIQENTKPAK